VADLHREGARGGDDQRTARRAGQRVRRDRHWRRLRGGGKPEYDDEYQ
jgi:hypothetical protein